MSLKEYLKFTGGADREQINVTNPVCVVCNKPVDYFVGDYNYMNFTSRFVVKCHGETETIELRDCDLVNTGNNGIIIGFVFVAEFILVHEV